MVIAADTPNPTCVCFSSDSRSVCVSSLSSFALVSPCPSLFEWGFFFCCCGGGAWRNFVCREYQKRTKNKRKTQKLGWLWEPDRSCERKAGDRRRGSLPGLASVFRSRPVTKPCPVRSRSLFSHAGWIVSEKKAKQNDRHRNSASIAGQPDQSSSGVAVKTETRVLRRVVLYRLPSSCVPVPSRSRKRYVIIRGTPGVTVPVASTGCSVQR